MKYAAYIALAFACLFAGFSARSANIALRATHADEAEQATTALNLRDTGKYEYNPNGPHGPTLYYWADCVKLPPSSCATIGDFRKAMTPIAVLALVALLLTGRYIGRGAAWAAVACLSMSAVFQIYSGYFVHEIIFAAAIFLTALAAWRFACAPTAAAALLVGALAGLSQATKETSVIAFAAMGLSFCVCAAAEKNIRENLSYILFTRNFFKFAAAFAVGFAAVFAAFYSSFGANWGGIADAVKSYSHFLAKSGSDAHASGFAYYLQLLTLQKSEGAVFGELPIAILALAGIGFAIARRKKSAWRCAFAMFAFCNGAFAVLILSLIKYKTPWLLLSPDMFLCAAAGFGAASLLSMKNVWARTAAFAAVAALAFWQYKLSANASERYASDPRNPFIYSHTVRDFSNLEKRIREAAKFSEYKNDIPVAFVMRESPWPAPFDLRDLRNTGFWSGGKIPENLPIFDVVVCDGASEDALSAALPPEKYAREFYGLRKNLVLTAFIKKDIFEKIVNQDAK